MCNIREQRKREVKEKTIKTEKRGIITSVSRGSSGAKQTRIDKGRGEGEGERERVTGRCTAASLTTTGSLTKCVHTEGR